MRLWKGFPATTNRPQLMKARPKCEVAGFEGVENLKDLRKRGNGRNLWTYVVKELNQPRCVAILQVVHAAPVLLPMEEFREFAGELWRKFVEATEPLYRSGQRHERSCS